MSRPRATTVRGAKWSFAPVSELGSVAEYWTALNAASGRLPILDSRFFELLIEHFGIASGAVIAVLQDAERVHCAAILEPAFLGWQTYQPSQAPLGAWVSAAEFQTTERLPKLVREKPLRWALGISQLDPELVSRPAPSSAVRTVDYIDIAAIDVSGTFADYWACRGKNLRTNLKRQRSRFERGGITPRLEVFTEPDAVGAAVDDYGRLESRGWKAADGTALHPDNAQGRFYSALLREYAAKGEAIVYQYRYGNDLVASDLCLMRGDVLIILKTTYDETQRNSSPAMLMHQEILEPIFAERRFRRIEFYGKLMDWHGRLTERKRTVYHLNCFRFGWLAQLADARRKWRARAASANSGATTQTANEGTYERD